MPPRDSESLQECSKPHVNQGLGRLSTCPRKDYLMDCVGATCTQSELSISGRSGGSEAPGLALVLGIYLLHSARQEVKSGTWARKARQHALAMLPGRREGFLEKESEAAERLSKERKMKAQRVSKSGDEK